MKTKIKNLIEEELNNFFESKENNLENNILINGNWGSGKTTLINEIALKDNEGNEDKKFKKVIINLWELEVFPEEIVQVLVLKLCEKLQEIETFEQTNEKWEKRNKVVKNIAVFFGVVCNNLLKNVTKIDFLETIKDYKEINNLVNDNQDKSIEKIYNRINEFKELKKSLEELLNIYSENYKLLIVFDDLDRCEPENIHKILTAIKNLFLFLKLNKCFFIIAANKKQVCFSQNYDVGNYMEKIFSKEINLNKYNIYDENLMPYLKDNSFFAAFIKQFNIQNFRLLNKIKKIESIDNKILEFIFFYFQYRKLTDNNFCNFWNNFDEKLKKIDTNVLGSYNEEWLSYTETNIKKINLSRTAVPLFKLKYKDFFVSFILLKPFLNTEIKKINLYELEHCETINNFTNFKFKNDLSNCFMENDNSIQKEHLIFLTNIIKEQAAKEFGREYKYLIGDYVFNSKNCFIWHNNTKNYQFSEINAIFDNLLFFE